MNHFDSAERMKRDDRTDAAIFANARTSPAGSEIISIRQRWLAGYGMDVLDYVTTFNIGA